MQELRDGQWSGTELDYQKVLPDRLLSMWYVLNHIVQQVDPDTGRFRRTWVPGRAICNRCTTQ